MNEKDWEFRRDGEMVKGYWESRFHPHRDLIVERLKDFEPFDSVLEIGSNVGPNLFRIQQKYPLVKLTGMDINMEAVVEGKKFLPEVEFVRGNVRELPFKNKMFDVVISDAVLIYISHNEFRQVIEEMLRVVKRGMILVELKNDIDDYWTRDYKKILEEEHKLKVKEEKISEKIWMDKPWKEEGYIYECHLPFPTLDKN